MDSNQKIIVPIDFKTESEAALDYAVKIASKIQAEIILLHVLEEENPFLKMVLTDNQREIMQTGAKQKLAELAAQKTQRTSIKYSLQVRTGKVYNTIVNVVKEIHAGFICMGRTGTSDLVKNITGTNTMHIVREADIPVITLNKFADKQGFQHILLPLDLTKQTFKKVEDAISVAKILGARITIVSLLDVHWISHEIKFNTRLRKIRDIIENFDIECDHKLLKDRDPDIPILLNKFARDIQADMIMIMTQQELDFKEYIIGSIAQEIINRSEYPVLSLTPSVASDIKIPDKMIKSLIDPINIFKE